MALPPLQLKWLQMQFSLVQLPTQLTVDANCFGLDQEDEFSILFEVDVGNLISANVDLFWR